MGKPHVQHHAAKLNTNPTSMPETTIALKVLIHCEGCKRKVKRVIKCVDGVESVVVEPQNGKVTVSGKGFDAKDVLQSLHEAGKFAEIWHLGGVKLPHTNQPHGAFNAINKPNNFLNHGNEGSNIMKSNGNGLTAGGWEKSNLENKGSNFKGKVDDFNSRGGHPGLTAGKLDLPQLGAQKPPFPNGDFARGGQFDKPTLPSNNIAIMSRSVAPVPSIYRGETSEGPLERSDYASADFATHLFSDENANNCSIM